MCDVNHEFSTITNRLVTYTELIDNESYQGQLERELVRLAVKIVVQRIREILPELTDEELLNHALSVINEATIGTVAFLETKSIWEELEMRLRELGFGYRTFEKPFHLPRIGR